MIIHFFDCDRDNLACMTILAPVSDIVQIHNIAFDINGVSCPDCLKIAAEKNKRPVIL